MDETPRPLSDRQPGALENDKCPVETGWLSSEEWKDAARRNLLCTKQESTPGVLGRTAGIGTHGRA